MVDRTEPLWAAHPGATPVRSRSPRGMTRAKVTPEQTQIIQTLALSVFTDMSNAGLALREVLAAVFMSGMNLAIELQKDASP